MRSAEWFKTVCDKNEFVISDLQAKLLKEYVSALLSWNERINLISRRDEDNVWEKHILESTAFLFRLDLHPRTLLLDVGTGGGLPGIPIAILRPNVDVVLVDSIQKKMAAVEEIIHQIGLGNASTLPGRAEHLSGLKEWKYRFDYVMVRAVAPAKDIVKWCRDFLSAGTGENPAGGKIIPTGTLLLLKGGDLEEELERLRVKIKPRRLDVYSVEVKGVDPDTMVDKKLLVIDPRGVNAAPGESGGK